MTVHCIVAGSKVRSVDWQDRPRVGQNWVQADPSGSGSQMQFPGLSVTQVVGAGTVEPYLKAPMSAVMPGRRHRRRVAGCSPPSVVTGVPVLSLQSVAGTWSMAGLSATHDEWGALATVHSAWVLVGPP